MGGEGTGHHVSHFCPVALVHAFHMHVCTISLILLLIIYASLQRTRIIQLPSKNSGIEIC